MNALYDILLRSYTRYALQVASYMVLCKDKATVHTAARSEDWFACGLFDDTGPL